MLRVAFFGPSGATAMLTTIRLANPRYPPRMGNSGLLLALKLVVLVSWFVAAAGFLFPADTTFGEMGRLLFGLLALVHTTECLAFYATLKRTGRPLAFELLQTLLFGAIHFSEAKALAEAREER